MHLPGNRGGNIGTGGPGTGSKPRKGSKVEKTGVPYIGEERQYLGKGGKKGGGCLK